MPNGIEAVGGTAEKILPLVRFPILMRVVLPGAATTALVWPFLGIPLDLLSLDPAQHWRKLVLIALMVFVSGALISAINGEVYKIYEGRIFWPRRLWDRAVARQQARVGALRRAEQEALEARDKARRAEIWYQLRAYPIDGAGNQEARYPTLLGNILAGYEQYPLTRYGMDSIFYWPRLWLLMEKEKKEEIDSAWSVADGFLSLSAVGAVGGTLWILAAAGTWCFDLSLHLPKHSAAWTATTGLVWIVFGYGFYRLSIPFHRQNGETFKALFDMYRDKIWPLTQLQPQEVEVWRRTWSYLQYKRLRCPQCDEPGQQPGKSCTKCGKAVPGFR